MKVLCVFGRHQYGDPQRGDSTEYSAFMPALSKLGHDVHHFESWDGSYYEDNAQLNRMLLEKVNQLRPDVMFTVQFTHEIWIETLLAIRHGTDTSTVCWTTDDSWRYREFSRFVGRYYDAMTTTYAECVEKYHHDGIPNVLLTQWAANSSWLQEPLPAAQCKHKVTFVGSAYGDRMSRVETLRNAGIPVECFGHGWPGGAVTFSEIPRIMRDSVVSLNFAGAPSYKSGPMQIKARTFEIPGAGGLLVTDDAPGLSDCYKPNEEVVSCSSMSDMRDKIIYILNHPDERNRIARNGFKRTQREHTYEERVRRVLDFAVHASRQRRISRLATSSIDFDLAVRRHQMTIGLRSTRAILCAISRMFLGPNRGMRAARRLVSEISWRLAGDKTFSASGWPGRMFPRR